jgi:hypothetical protein
MGFTITLNYFLAHIVTGQAMPLNSEHKGFFPMKLCL